MALGVVEESRMAGGPRSSKPEILERTPRPGLGRTHCPQGHPYSGDNLYIDPAGNRGAVPVPERSLRRPGPGGLSSRRIQAGSRPPRRCRAHGATRTERRRIALGVMPIRATTCTSTGWATGAAGAALCLIYGFEPGFQPVARRYVAAYAGLPQSEVRNAVFSCLSEIQKVLELIIGSLNCPEPLAQP